MISKRFIISLVAMLLTGCGFHFKTTNLFIDFSAIEPRNELNQFVNLANSLGIQNDAKSKIKLSNLEIKPKLISTQNTGNKWRQYEYTASWNLNYKNTTYKISNTESINIPSNQSPYQTNIISEQLNGLRVQLLQETKSTINSNN